MCINSDRCEFPVAPSFFVAMCMSDSKVIQVMTQRTMTVQQQTHRISSTGKREEKPRMKTESQQTGACIKTILFEDIFISQHSFSFTIFTEVFDIDTTLHTRNH